MTERAGSMRSRVLNHIDGMSQTELHIHLVRALDELVLLEEDRDHAWVFAKRWKKAAHWYRDWAKSLVPKRYRSDFYQAKTLRRKPMSRADEEIHRWKGSELDTVEVTRGSDKVNPTLSIRYNGKLFSVEVCTVDLRILQSALALVSELKDDAKADRVQATERLTG